MAKIKEVTFYKEFKCGLPNYSNITTAYGMTLDVGDGEEVDNVACWDKVNRELSTQSDNIDATWIQTKEYSNFFKTSVKTPKTKGSE
jgi:hypothetical protein